MRQTTAQRLHRHAVLVFVAAVTVCCVAFAFEQASKGLAGIPGLLVYAFAAGFGLESLGSSWTCRWRQLTTARRW